MARHLLLSVLIFAARLVVAEGMELPDDANALAAHGAGAEPSLVLWCNEHQVVTRCAAAAGLGNGSRLFDIPPDATVGSLHHGRRGDVARVTADDVLAVVAARRPSHRQPLELLVQHLTPAGLPRSEPRGLATGVRLGDFVRCLPDGEGGAWIVWTRPRAGEHEVTIWAGHVLSDGTPDGPAHVLVDRAAGAYFDAVAFSRRGLLLVWTEAIGLRRHEARVARFTFDDRHVVETQVLHAQLADEDAFPRVALQEHGDLLFAWRTNAGRVCARLLNGTESDIDVAAASIAGSHRVAARGDGFVAAWRDPANSVYARTLLPDQGEQIAIVDEISRPFLSLSCNEARCAVYIVVGQQVVRRDF